MGNKTYFYGQKIKTGIDGLDSLLYGGLYLKCPNPLNIKYPLCIAIYGDRGTSKALLAMQLMCGITRSVMGMSFKTTIDGKNVDLNMLSPLFISDNKSLDALCDMMLDLLISQTVSEIIKDNAEGKKNWVGNVFCQTVFDLDGKNLRFPLKYEELDRYVGEEMLVYNNHTNALHFATPTNQYDRKNIKDDPIFSRKKMSVKEFADKMNLACIKSGNIELSSNFFNVNFYAENENTLGFVEYGDISETEVIPCIVIDNINSKGCIGIINKLINKSLVSIFILDDEPDKRTPFDLMIELRRYENETVHYVFNQICIKKSTMQDTAIGWHVYKKRDYGIEIYPSPHVILQKRRHMHKGLLLSQRDVLSGTYQRYLDELSDINDIYQFKNYENRYNDGLSKIEKLSGFYKHFNNERKRECPIDVLRKILMLGKGCTVRGESTAIIGLPNAYKRFITHSSTFNACCNGVHTLYILLDKDHDIMLRRMICPAYVCKGRTENVMESAGVCNDCYNYIHFTNIRMGCISSNEFFYYLIKQIKISRESDNHISRIVIDDLQKIEFCFPMLYYDTLFLTTLISICKDYNVDLYMLCDKSSSLIPALRAQADNVICTKKTGIDKFSIYIERYAGYSTPSRMWKCNVNKASGMFYCDAVNSRRQLCMDERFIENGELDSVDEYWTKE